MTESLQVVPLDVLAQAVHNAGGVPQPKAWCRPRKTAAQVPPIGTQSPPRKTKAQSGTPVTQPGWMRQQVVRQPVPPPRWTNTHGGGGYQPPGIRPSLVMPPVYLRSPVIVQPLPAQQPLPQRWRLVRGVLSGLVIGACVFPVIFGGVKGCVLATVFLLIQTGLVLLLFVFPDSTPPTQPWEQHLRTGLLLSVSTLIAVKHCTMANDLVKNEANDPWLLAIFCCHGFYLLAAFLLSHVFIS
jgi:hypothetical protein